MSSNIPTKGDETMQYNGFSEAASTSQRPAPIGEAMTRFDFENANLCKAIEKLIERLQPILMADNPRPALPRVTEREPRVGAETQIVPLASAIHNQIDCMCDQTQRLADLYARIGV
jgi:hypothetical protein